MLKVILNASILLTLVSCQKPQVDIHVPEVPAAVVIDGGVVCTTTVVGWEKVESDHCRNKDEVMTGKADNGIECGKLVTKCWVEKTE